MKRFPNLIHSFHITVFFLKLQFNGLPMRKKPKYILRAEGICHFVNVSKHFKMTAAYLRLLSNEYIFYGK